MRLSLGCHVPVEGMEAMNAEQVASVGPHATSHVYFFTL